MSEEIDEKKIPISTVRFGIGKEMQLYLDELVVTVREEGRETRVPLETIQRLTLMPGDPTPSKLILMADLTDDSTILLAEGMSNARDFRAMIPHLVELCPDLNWNRPIWLSSYARRSTTVGHGQSPAMAQSSCSVFLCTCFIWSSPMWARTINYKSEKREIVCRQWKTSHLCRR